MNGEETNGLLRILIALILLLLVVSAIFGIYSLTKKGLNTEHKKLNNLNEAMADSNYTDYEGQIITGSQVLSLLNNYKNEEICMKVGSTTFNYTDASLKKRDTTHTAAKASRRDSGYYISPSAEYEVTLVRDKETREIRVMQFTIQ